MAKLQEMRVRAIGVLDDRGASRPQAQGSIRGPAAQAGAGRHGQGRPGRVAACVRQPRPQQARQQPRRRHRPARMASRPGDPRAVPTAMVRPRPPRPRPSLRRTGPAESPAAAGPAASPATAGGPAESPERARPPVPFPHGQPEAPAAASASRACAPARRPRPPRGRLRRARVPAGARARHACPAARGHARAAAARTPAR